MKVALIPAYNAVHTIAEVIVKSKRYVDKVIVYDDGSIDDTKMVAEGCGAIVFREETNRGKGYALKRLFEYAKGLADEGDVFVTLDADMQHDPDDIPKLIEPILQGEADFVVGVRETMPKHRALGGRILDLLTGGGLRLKDTQSGFRAYSLKALKSINIKTDGFAVDSQILMDLVPKVRVVPIAVKSRYDEFSHTRFFISHFLEVFNYVFLRRPLLHLGLTGLSLFCLGLYGLYDVTVWWNTFKELAVGRMLISITTALLGALTFFVGVILHVIKGKT